MCNETTSSSSNFSSTFYRFEVLSTSIMNHCFTFLNEYELSNMAGTNKLFAGLIKSYVKIIENVRLRAWKNMRLNILSIPLQAVGNPNNMRLRKDVLHWNSVDPTVLHFINLRNGTRDFIITKGSKISGTLDERFSVFDSVNGWTCLDNIERRIQSIIIPKTCKENQNPIAVFSSNKLNKTIDIITSKGMIFIFNPNKECSTDTKESSDLINPNVSSICCISEEENQKGVEIEKAYKVNDSYYFLKTSKNAPSGKQFITFMKDKRAPQIQENIEIFSQKFVVTNHFLCVLNLDNLIVYRGSDIWKQWKFSNELKVETMQMFPSNYGLVTKCTSNDDKIYLSVWDLHKYQTNTDKVSPIFHNEITSNTEIFVHNDLIILNKDNALSLIHIPTQQQIGLLRPECEEVLKIMVSDDPLPTDVVVFCSGGARRIKIKGGNKFFKIFSSNNASSMADGMNENGLWVFGQHRPRRFFVH